MSCEVQFLCNLNFYVMIVYVFPGLCYGWKYSSVNLRVFLKWTKFFYVHMYVMNISALQQKQCFSPNVFGRSYSVLLFDNNHRQHWHQTESFKDMSIITSVKNDAIPVRRHFWNESSSVTSWATSTVRSPRDVHIMRSVCSGTPDF